MALHAHEAREHPDAAVISKGSAVEDLGAAARSVLVEGPVKPSTHSVMLKDRVE